MTKYLVDVNLPKYFSIWKHENYLHVSELDSKWSDTKIWNYAKENDLVIITKDADFYSKIIVSTPPPKVIHLKIGNFRIKELHEFLSRIWNDVEVLIASCKLVTIYADRIEGLKHNSL
ncbi:MAG: DUF5615 family PIN-like protein [Bacteroidia bacterium]